MIAVKTVIISTARIFLQNEVNKIDDVADKFSVITLNVITSIRGISVQNKIDAIARKFGSFGDL